MSAIHYLILAADGLNSEDRAVVENWLTAINSALLILIVLLIVFALSVSYLARRSTRPCRWCMEFIGNGETVCPRCGKEHPHAALMTK